MVIKGYFSEGTTTTLLPLIIAGITVEINASKGYSSGNIIPNVPIASGIANVTFLNGV